MCGTIQRQQVILQMKKGCSLIFLTWEGVCHSQTPPVRIANHAELLYYGSHVLVSTTAKSLRLPTNHRWTREGRLLPRQLPKRRKGAMHPD